MKMVKPAILGTLMVPAFMFAAGTVNAEENTATMEATYLTETPAGTFHADALTGNQVKSSVEDDEDIGTITDLVIDEDGQINAVVVGVGGFLGMGEKNVAIEWDSLELTKDEDGENYVITVNASEDALEAAEEYQRSEDKSEDE
ncbi:MULTISPECIES: PRC-barrel domain-containing protein [unclassified Halomonas]|uniref:PRC-barrel domain-containing protein n=1 Tax=unclassified Halomonas TaxID=2609666 RepID=UPI001CF52167|nr:MULTISPECIES: PRC-barrel domain-containing protein [unclassified Halomonas]MCA8864036.1 PRC-barrel domain containing protein [Halomonas sp. SBBP1]UZH11276.1 PRC-barrel domain-containing protein [Halomonas sp. BDJS001]